MRTKPVVDAQFTQRVFRSNNQFTHRQTVRHIKAHREHIFNLPVTVDEPCIGMCGIGIVKFGNFLSDRYARTVDGRDGSQQLPQILIGLVIEHSPAADDISLIGITSSVIATAENGHFFDNVNMFSGKDTISNQISCTRQRCNAAPYKIDLFITVIFLHDHSPPKGSVITSLM